MKKILLNIFCIAAMLFTGVNSIASPVTGDADGVVKEILVTQDVKADATLAVLKKIQEAKANGGNATIKFEKGTYHFYPEFAFEKFEFFSNHGDYLTRFAFYLDNMDNLTIDGNGSKFILHGILAPILAENCNNLNIKNMDIDYAEAFHSEGTIVACDSVNKTYDLRISEEYPYEIRNGQLIFLKSYYEHPIGQNYAFDSETKHIAFNSSHMPYMTPKQRKFIDKNSFNVNKEDYIHDVDKFDWYIRNRGIRELTTAEQLEPGLVRIHTDIYNNLKVGWVMIMKGHQGFQRLFAGVKIEECKDVNLEGINLYHAAGMGFLGENSENLDLYKCSSVASNDRYVSVTADATHFSGCRGNLSMRNCVFESELDDGTNIHGAYQLVENILDDHTIGIRAIHHQQLGFIIGREDDEIAIINPDKEYLPHATLTLKSIERVNGRYMILTFKDKLPEDIKKDYLIENLTAYPEVLIENSRFCKNRARALIISTPKKAVIRNNYFSVEMAGIILGGTGFDPYWGECGYASNILIEGNTFRDCGHGNKEIASLIMNSSDDYEGYPIKNIVVRGNKFEQSENWVMNVGRVDGLVFEDNIITNTGTFPQRFKDRAAITVEDSKNISFKRNKYSGKATKMVDYLDDSTEKVKFK